MTKDTLLRTLLASAAIAGYLAVPAAGYALEAKAPLTAPQDAEAADDADADGEKKDAAEAKDKKDTKKEKTIEDKVKDFTSFDGLFKLYQDPKTGALSMEISADQIDKDFIYFSHINDGAVTSGHFRGQFRREIVFKVRKYFDRIEFVQINPNFYFDPKNALARAKDANISDSIIHSAKIEATTKGTGGAAERYLVKADKLFISEDFDRINPPAPRGGQGGPERFSLGKLAPNKSKISAVHNYPANTAISVDLVYSNPDARVAGGNDIADPRSVTVNMQHTLVALPKNDFKPRFDDARVGYFMQEVTDLTELESVTPYRDVINRWNLVKKDPSAKLSEPVEPITWWIENTTPLELRPVIKEAVEAWNIAFEAAGFKNAVVVKTQPDDADWDAGDIRYNVLRWTSSPRPPFGGYGPSFVNPLTGQIMAADIMLEYSFLSNRFLAGKIFSNAGLPGSEDDAQANIDAVMQDLNAHAQYCSVANALQLGNMFGKTMTMALKGDIDAADQLTKESIYYLMLHEVGHTLGLNHNMKATQARSYETAHDISAQKDGLVGSVMDYPAINFAPKGEKQAHFYTTKPGPYDIWAIQFGYSPEMEDAGVRKAHLARSLEPALAFGNDADDMRSPGKAIDPRVNIFDFSDDAVKYAKDVMVMSNEAIGTLIKKFTPEGGSYEALRDAYLVTTGYISRQAAVVSRYIGGVQVERGVVGQKGATQPYTPVSEAKQREAMGVLRDYIFAPDAFAVDAKLLSHMAIQRRGFDHFAEGEDPRIHARVIGIQSDVLAHLLHPSTLQRMTDSALYGNSYSVTEMMGDLTDAIFEADSRTSVNSFRQGLQLYYVKELIKVMQGSGDYVAQSNALANLRDIRGNMARWRGDAATRAHRDHISFIIDKALETHADS